MCANKSAIQLWDLLQVGVKVLVMKRDFIAIMSKTPHRITLVHLKFVPGEEDMWRCVGVVQDGKRNFFFFTFLYSWVTLKYHLDPLIASKKLRTFMECRLEPREGGLKMRCLQSEVHDLECFVQGIGRFLSLIQICRWSCNRMWSVVKRVIKYLPLLMKILFFY